MDLQDHITNKVNYDLGVPLTGILGTNPSKGARSPHLWNAAFSAHGLGVAMLPLDVPPENLKNLFQFLDRDCNFLGGAVTVPHKEEIAKLLGRRITQEASKIGAVNCLYRGTDGRIWGTNTDGEGAIKCLEYAVGDLCGKNIAVLGCGGAGRSVAAYLAAAVGRSGEIILVVRSPEKLVDFAGRIDSECVRWDELPSICSKVDIVVNTTTIGSANSGNLGKSPIATNVLATLSKSVCVYDIVYDPSPTQLLMEARNYGLQTLDGTCMNLEQAILSFAYASSEPKGENVTREAMQVALRNL